MINGSVLSASKYIIGFSILMKINFRILVYKSGNVIEYLSYHFMNLTMIRPIVEKNREKDEERRKRNMER
jgi:hypothetical protein